MQANILHLLELTSLTSCETKELHHKTIFIDHLLMDLQNMTTLRFFVFWNWFVSVLETPLPTFIPDSEHNVVLLDIVLPTDV